MQIRRLVIVKLIRERICDAFLSTLCEETALIAPERVQHVRCIIYHSLSVVSIRKSVPVFLVSRFTSVWLFN